MRVKVLFRGKSKVVKTEAKTVEKLLLELGFNPEAVIVLCNNSIVPLRSRLAENEELNVISVVSGG